MLSACSGNEKVIEIKKDSLRALLIQKFMGIIPLKK